MAQVNQEQPISLTSDDYRKTTVDRWIRVVSSLVDRYTEWLLVGYVLFMGALLLVASAFWIWAERPVDDIAGLIKNVDDVAAESTITLESFDADLQTARASVQVRPPWFFDRQMNSVRKLGLTDEALKQLTFQFGELKVRDQVLNFKFDGVKLDSSDLGFPAEFLKPEDWKSDAPPMIKDIELTAEGNPRFYPFDTYLVIGRMDIPLRVNYQQKSVDVLWKNYSAKSKLGGFLLTALSLDKLKELANDVKPSSGIIEARKDREANKHDATVERRAQALYGLSPDDAWIASRFAIEIRRPILFRILAVLLMITATASSLWISFKTEPKDYISTAAGYLVAMWAAKSILGGQAPKTPSLLDYLIVVLFFVQSLVIAIRAYATRNAKNHAAGFGAGVQ